MDEHGLPNGVPGTRRHGAHDSALDVEPKDDDMLRLRLQQLEEENQLLVEKATSASQRFADYENEIRVLNTQLREQQDRVPAEPEQSSLQPDRPSLSRLGSFMRKGSLVPGYNSSSGPSVREQELEASLAKEQTARIEAEKKVKEVTSEIEDLSATLFQQANDMVATERRENAALKERIQELERIGSDSPDVTGRKENERLRQKVQLLEQRDKDRHKRLEKLEAAQKRIDRVRTMLVPR